MEITIDGANYLGMFNGMALIGVGAVVGIALKPKPDISNVGSYTTTITLVGEYANNEPFGQMFPFVAIEVVESSV